MKAKSKQNEVNDKSEPQQLTIKECFVRLAKINKEKESSVESVELAFTDKEEIVTRTKSTTMETEKTEQQVVKRGRGRPSMASKKAEAEARKADKALKKTAATATASDGEEGTEEVTPTAASAVEKLAASKRMPLKKRNPATPPPVAIDEGRSRRTPKPNPRYMNDDTVVITKQMVKDESQSENEDDEDEGDAERSADDDDDDEREKKKDTTPYTGKRRGRPPKSAKRGAQPSVVKSTPIAEQNKVASTSSQSVKRKITETDIDIDDEHGKQLFLDAKRRLTHSPRDNSDDDFATPKGKSSLSSSADTTSPSALAAKLRAKFSHEIAAKRTPGRHPKSTIRISPKFMNKAGKEKLLKSASAPKRSSSNDDTELSVESADLEDQMPTFTIVNINDIMNQKNGDAVLVRKRKLHQETAVSNKKREISTDSSEEDLEKEVTSDSESPLKSQQQQQNNRRKTQHTKILSDDKLAKGTAKTPTSGVSRVINSRTAQVKQHLLSKGVPLSSSGSASNVRTVNNKPAILRQTVPPPRILNSSLCKPGKSPNLVTKLITSDELKNKQNNNAIRSKENNVTSYTFTEKDGRLVQSKKILASPVKAVQQTATRTPIRSQMINNNRSLQMSMPMPLPMPLPVSTERRMKKITCFETWHVIKTPEIKRVNEKSILMVDMVKLGNKIKELQLPSADWSYKIVLAKQNLKVIKKIEEKNPDGSPQKAINDPTTELYTGEIHDQEISEADKHMYKPSNIFFRRKPKAGQSKLQFDRTVIFKNRTTLIKIDERPIHLITAPQFIYTLRDIEILLQVVNDVTLKNVDVEILPGTS